MSGIQAMLLSSGTVIPGNSGIITSAGTYTLPTTSGFRVKVLAIAGGGGGGGGSGRTAYSGYYTGGGGGGAGGNAYAEFSVIPGQTITIDQVGGGGSAGVARDGIYSSGSNGGSGSMTIVSAGSSSVQAVGGNVPNAALVSPTGTAGSTGYAFVGTPLIAARNGVSAPSGTTYGGNGAAGYIINTTVGATTILTYGSYGTTYAEGVTNTYNTAGTGYGAGGSGGSCAQSDVYVPSYNIGGVAGVGGAVFIWWGY